MKRGQVLDKSLDLGLTGTATSWSEALEEAQYKLGAAVARTKKLRRAIVIMKGKVERGEAYPMGDHAD